MTLTERLKRQSEFDARRHQEAIEINTCKDRLAALHGLERNAKFETAWKIAWDFGHSNGFGEVESYFGELVPLLKP